MAALKLQPQPGLAASATIVDALRDQSRLVVLDNCEHLLEPVAALVQLLHGAAASVRVVATSREAFGIAGEQIFPVPSLPSETDGVELFVTRCQAADPTFEVAGNDLESVVQLCRRLDGIPLAIELAAARARTLSPTDLLDRLEDRFRLLRGARRGVVDRHRTLQAAVEWSYQLLDETERDVFCRLSVFPASFDLAAAGDVCADELDEFEVVDLVEALVDKSLVTSFRHNGTTRFRMLETLRQYGEAQLDDDLAAHLRDRHAAHYVGVAEEARVLFEEADGYVGGELFDTEWDNIRIAAAWAAMAPELGDLEQLLTSTAYYGGFSLRIHELTATMADAAARPDCSTTILGVTAFAEFSRGNLAEALALCDKAMVETDGDPGLWCLNAAYLSYWYSGNIEQGWHFAQETVKAARASGRLFDLFAALAGAAVMAGTVPAPGLVPIYLEELKAIEAELGSVVATAHGAWASASSVGQDRDDARIQSDLQRAYDLADHPSLAWTQTSVLMNQALGHSRRTDPEAPRALRTAIERLRDSSAWPHVWLSIEGTAIHRRCGRPCHRRCRRGPHRA